ncbi:MAG: hypothetical protein ACPKM0_08080 [Pleomorphochaeta sp.]
MKKVVFLLLFNTIVLVNIFSIDDSSSIDIAIDISYIDPIFNEVIYNEITPSLNVTQDLSLRIPFNLVIPVDRDIDLLGLGASIDVLYRPFLNNFFISFSLIKFEYLLGLDAPYEDFQYLNKLSFGYTFLRDNKVYIEPAISFFNLNGIYEDSILVLQESYNDFPVARLSILIGYRILNINTKKEEKINVS